MHDNQALLISAQAQLRYCRAEKVQAGRRALEAYVFQDWDKLAQCSEQIKFWNDCILYWKQRTESHRQANLTGVQS